MSGQRKVLAVAVGVVGLTAVNAAVLLWCVPVLLRAAAGRPLWDAGVAAAVAPMVLSLSRVWVLALRGLKMASAEKEEALQCDLT